MASIKTYLDAIKAAVYGEEVRGSIHDAIKVIYDMATGAQNSATASANTAIAKASEAVTAAKNATAKAEEAIEAAEQAQTYADNASAVTGIKIATQTEAGLVKGGENYIDESGELQLTKRTTSPTLYNSYAGGIKLNELGGVSEQDSTTGAQLYNVRDKYNSFDIGDEDRIYIALDNSSGASTLYSTANVNDSELLIPNTPYTIVAEVTNWSGNGSIEVVSAATDATKGQFNSSCSIAKDGVHVFRLTTRDNFDGCTTMLRTVVVAGPGKTVNCKLRISVLADTSITADTFVYEKFTGNAASPSPEYKQTFKPVEGKNLLDCRGLTEQTVNGGKFTPVYDDNGNLLYIEVDGTFAARSTYLLNRIAISEKCIVNGAPTNGRIQLTSTDTQYNDYGSGTTIPSGFEGSVYIIVDANTTLTNLKFYPMIRPASIADDTYVPYGLLRFWGHGKNVFDRFSMKRNTSNAGIVVKSNDDGSYSYVGTATSNDVNVWLLGSWQSTEALFTLKAGVKYFIKGVNLYYNSSPRFTAGREGMIITFAEDTPIGGVRAVDAVSGKTYNETHYPIIVESDVEVDWQPRKFQSITLSNPIKLNGVGTAQDRFVRKDGVWKIERNVKEHTAVSTGVVYNKLTLSKQLRYICPSDCKLAKYMCTMGHTFIYYPWDTDVVGLFGFGGATESDRAFAILLPVDADITEYETMDVLYQLKEPTYEDLPTADQIALNSLVSYDGITYLYCDSEVQPTWDLEYGTSRVGGYTLEAWNEEKNNKIKIEEAITAMLVMNQE